MIRIPDKAGADKVERDKNGMALPFFKTRIYREIMARHASVELPTVKEVPASELITFLKSMGKGWDAELEGLLEIPRKLFYIQVGAYAQYSGNDAPDMGAIFQALKMRSKTYSTEMDYGILVYDTTSSTYFVLFDAKRRIVVHDHVQSYGDNSGSSWSGIKWSIKRAIELAGGSTAAAEGRLAVCDQGLADLATLARPK
jgi:hypothetical protein